MFGFPARERRAAKRLRRAGPRLREGRISKTRKEGRKISLDWEQRKTFEEHEFFAGDVTGFDLDVEFPGPEHEAAEV